MITKEKIIDKIEILEDGTVQLREKTRFFEDGVLVSESNTDRRVIDPGGDVTKENNETKAIIALVQTTEKITAFEIKKAKMEADLKTYDGTEEEPK
jgi:hypothetical protein